MINNEGEIKMEENSVNDVSSEVEVNSSEPVDTNSAEAVDARGYTENPSGLQREETTKTVVKPWGKEIWMALNDRYCYKRIYINAGTRTSYQYHAKKHETNFIISGEAEIWLENDEGVVEKFIARAGEFFDVVPPKKHRVIAKTDLVLQEVSTPEVDDVVRLQDDNNRGSGKIQSEHQ
jgi:mannose-6-phosphate isomerase